MTKEKFIEKLKQFCSKAGCIHTQRKAKSIWNEIENYLSKSEYNKIIIAWSHHVECGEGRNELDKIINGIIKSKD